MVPDIYIYTCILNVKFIINVPFKYMDFESILICIEILYGWILEFQLISTLQSIERWENKSYCPKQINFVLRVF
jgi:hypothetical protein